MPLVADFVTFSDDPFDLQKGADIDKTLEANISEVPASVKGARAILTWNVNRASPAGNVSYNVRVNDTQIYTDLIASSNKHFVQEVIPANIIQQGNNTVEFRVDHLISNITAILRISDVTLWYRKNV